jgi:hypothetical protein
MLQVGAEPCFMTLLKGIVAYIMLLRYHSQCNVVLLTILSRVPRRLWFALSVEYLTSIQ